MTTTHQLPSASPPQAVGRSYTQGAAKEETPCKPSIPLHTGAPLGASYCQHSGAEKTHPSCQPQAKQQHCLPIQPLGWDLVWGITGLGSHGGQRGEQLQNFPLLCAQKPARLRHSCLHQQGGMDPGEGVWER